MAKKTTNVRATVRINRKPADKDSMVIKAVPVKAYKRTVKAKPKSVVRSKKKLQVADQPNILSVKVENGKVYGFTAESTPYTPTGWTKTDLPPDISSLPEDPSNGMFDNSDLTGNQPNRPG